MRFHITVKKGIETVAELPGRVDVALSGDDQRILATEQFLERLTGLRFHINTAGDKAREQFSPEELKTLDNYLKG